jgi:hypothetical protein
MPINSAVVTQLAYLPLPNSKLAGYRAPCFAPNDPTPGHRGAIGYGYVNCAFTKIHIYLLVARN